MSATFTFVSMTVQHLTSPRYNFHFEFYSSTHKGNFLCAQSLQPAGWIPCVGSIHGCQIQPQIYELGQSGVQGYVTQTIRHLTAPEIWWQRAVAALLAVVVGAINVINVESPTDQMTWVHGLELPMGWRVSSTALCERRLLHYALELKWIPFCTNY